jgi:hypothetical protein
VTAEHDRAMEQILDALERAAYLERDHGYDDEAQPDTPAGADDRETTDDDEEER